jgi:hypothetical protein
MKSRPLSPSGYSERPPRTAAGGSGMAPEEKHNHQRGCTVHQEKGKSPLSISAALLFKPLSIVDPGNPVLLELATPRLTANEDIANLA